MLAHLQKSFKQHPIEELVDSEIAPQVLVARGYFGFNKTCNFYIEGLFSRVLLRLSDFLAHLTKGAVLNTDQHCIFIFLPTVTKIWK